MITRAYSDAGFLVNREENNVFEHPGVKTLDWCIQF